MTADRTRGVVVFAVAAALSLLAAVASLLRGGRYVASDVVPDDVV